MPKPEPPQPPPARTGRPEQRRDPLIAREDYLQAANVVKPGQTLEQARPQKSWFEKHIHDRIFGTCHKCMIGRVCMWVGIAMVLLPTNIILWVLLAKVI